MPTVEIRFPGGRYHATPWGHHVNEGLVEWPPSPWRILRAFLATGYAKLRWPSAGPPDTARVLIEKLAATLPYYGLPPASGGHSRHYMPLGILDKGTEKTTLVFDTWAQVGDQSLIMRWDAILSDDETRILSDLVINLGYLGRAESWTAARLVSDETPFPMDRTAVPCDGGGHPGRGWEQVSLLAPTSAATYAGWRETSVAGALANLPGVDPTGMKLSKAAQKKINALQADFPRDLIACLQIDSSWLQRVGWSQPPGSQRVLYWRRADALEVTPTRKSRRRMEASPITAMLLAMATQSGNDHALPSISRTLPQAELLHRAFVSKLKRAGGSSSVLSGRDDDGDPLRTSHRHAHVLPLDLDLDGHIEHVLIWAPMGLDVDSQAAIRAVRETYTKGGLAPLRLALAADGSLADLSQIQGPYGDRLRALIGPARVWRSVTPFVPPRYLKKQGRNTIEGQVVSECQSRGLPTPTEVRVLDVREFPALLHLRHFVRTRRSGPAPPIDLGFPVEVRFDEPIGGLLSLGYGSHFGLGLFSALE